MIMTRSIKKYSVMAGVMTSLLLISCYEKFDPESYKPDFEISGFSSTDEIQAANLVAYWPFDGSLNDEVSGSEADNVGTTFTGGFKGQAIKGNVNDKSYVTFDPGSSITGLQSFTISFWVNPTFVDDNSDNGIDGILGLVNISKPDDFWGNLDWFVENGSNPSGSTIKIHIRSGGNETWVVASGVTNFFGKWSSHTVTYNAATSKFKYYINGSSVVTADAAWTGSISFVNPGPMVFGCVQFQTTPSIGCCGNQPWASYLTGEMDEIRIYKSALTDTEVNALVVLQGKGK
jgi:hypothetical protein